MVEKAASVLGNAEGSDGSWQQGGATACSSSWVISSSSLHLKVTVP